EHQNVAAQTAIDEPMQFGAAPQEIAREGDLVRHQFNELPTDTMRSQIRVGHAEARHVRARQIDASLGKIDRDILPEVGELQAAADEIGKLLALRVPIAEEIQDQAAHRIGGVPSIVEQGGHRREALEVNVAAEGREQI